MSVTTSNTLLMRLKDMDDKSAWDRFYDLYSPLVISFSLRRKCSQAMAYDVLQETMVCLMRIMPDFQYNPRVGRFHSFLFKVVDSRITDAYRRNRRINLAGSETEHRQLIECLEDSRVEEPGRQWDQLWRQNLLLRALDNVREMVHPQTYRSFQMYVLEERPICVVAAELGLNANAIYQHKNRVTKMLKKELELLLDEIGS